MISKKNKNSNIISNVVSNKKAYLDFFIEKIFEAGLILQSWEVKSLRLGIVDISTSYVSINKGEAFLYGVCFKKLITVIKNVENKHNCNACKLLLNKHEIQFLENKISKKGYTIIPLSIFLKKSWFKLKLGLAIGKKNKDKRLCIKKRDWIIEKNRIIKNSMKNN
ncbi:SsrA-binding protein [Buchnera aphidicola (Eriosoma lanigerum)]|uniref:SsrA-binding protein SmpB n=1 Tax=Buchnera aphidicola TaxID=9 RepID=UPI00346403F9